MLESLFILLEILLFVIFISAFMLKDSFLWALVIILSAVLAISSFGVTEHYTVTSYSNTTLTGATYESYYVNTVLSEYNQEWGYFFLNALAGLLGLILFFRDIFFSKPGEGMNKLNPGLIK